MLKTMSSNDSMGNNPSSRGWRSSQNYMIFAAVFALFTETLLYGYIVPILIYMVEVRLGLPHERTQNLTTALLAIHGFCALLSAPIIGYLGDKTRNRTYLLMSSLIGSAVGTAVIAWTPAVWVLFFGRVIQGIAGSATWIAAFSMLVDNIDEKRKGTILALAMSFVSCGVVAGPAISGAVFQLAGYWPTWAVPAALVPIAFITLLLVKPDLDPSPKSLADVEASTTDVTKPDVTVEREGTTSLLSTHEQEEHGYDTMSLSVKPQSGAASPEPERRPRGFYRVFLSDPRVIAGLACNLFQAAIMSGFDTTLSLHMSRTFHWGTLPVGMLFLGLQGPPILLGLLIGGLRDRFGVRVPTAVGWVLLAPSLWLIGASGDITSWANGEVAVIIGVVGVGFGFLLTRGAGSFQVVAVAKELESTSPILLGPNGANSKLSALMEIVFNLGIMVGPLVAGGLSATIGYCYMNCFLAIISLALAIVSLVFM